MIISPPFLPRPEIAVYDEPYIRKLMPAGTVGKGAFPVSEGMAWHGGLHIAAPSADEPVRAIADGVVIFRRDNATARYEGNDHSTGCIVIRHTTAIGAHGATAVEVVYYSIYQHLSKLDKDVPALNGKIYRKDPLGLAGTIHGLAQRIHLEIIAGKNDAEKLIGRTTGELALDRNGRTDTVYGQIYVLLPAQSACYAAQPVKAPLPAASGNSGTTPLVIGIRYEQGHATLTTYQLNGEVVGQAPVETEAEYNLYTEAVRRHSALSASEQASSSPSGWYELLRFGRNLGPDPLPANAPHWRKVVLPGQPQGAWVNLNGTGTHQFSDADFPHWMGWKLIDDDVEDDNSQCNSAAIDTLLSPAAQPRTATPPGPPSLTGSSTPAPQPPETAATTPAQRANNRLQNLNRTAMQERLGKTICRFPTEWAKEDVATRWSWLQKEGNPYLPHPLKPKDFDEMVTFAKKLCFWEDLPQEDRDRLGKKHWHFQPTEFIVHFRKCGWLSVQELIQLVPSHALRTGKDKKSGSIGSLWEVMPSRSSDKDNEIIANNLTPLNRMMQKYCINTPKRKTAFFGNAIQETAWLTTLTEGGGGKYWYAPWFGRGFLQLTHASNYFSYWAWRGRQIPLELKNRIEHAEKIEGSKKPELRNKSAMADENFPGITAEIINWRIATEFNRNLGDSPDRYLAPSDSAGFYWASLQMGKYADKDHQLERITVSTVNQQGTKIYYRSHAFWEASAAVNLPSAIKNHYSSRLNGFDSRCCAYGYAWAILNEGRLPDSRGALKVDFPEGYVKRNIQ